MHEREGAQQAHDSGTNNILAFWSVMEAAQQHRGFLEAMAKPERAALGHGHTSFFIVKKEISLCYGLGLALVHQDFPFQSIREKEFQKRIKGMANS